MSGYIGNIPVPQATQTRESFTATASQTTFNTAGYTPNFLDVFLNGVHLLNGTDYTATNGSDVVLTTGAAASDVVEVISYSTYEVNAQTYTGGLTVNNDGATVLTVDRATSDGSIVDFKKSGTTVGSIGSNGGSRLYIESGDVGLRLLPDQDDIRPSYNSGASRDAAIDLGDGLARFKDLYLSGGVYLGGTGAANKLDDYEEGTFTPVLSTSNFTNTGFSSTSCSYVKVGGMVTVQLDLIFAGTSGSWAVGNYFELSSLPFPAEQPSGADNYYSGTLNASTSYSTNTKSTWDVLQSGFGLLCLCTYSNGSPTKGAAVIGSYTYNTSV